MNSPLYRLSICLLLKGPIQSLRNDRVKGLRRLLDRWSVVFVATWLSRRVDRRSCIVRQSYDANADIMDARRFRIDTNGWVEESRYRMLVVGKNSTPWLVCINILASRWQRISRDNASSRGTDCQRCDSMCTSWCLGFLKTVKLINYTIS